MQQACFNCDRGADACRCDQYADDRVHTLKIQLAHVGRDRDNWREFSDRAGASGFYAGVILGVLASCVCVLAVLAALAW